MQLVLDNPLFLGFGILTLVNFGLVLFLFWQLRSYNRRQGELLNDEEVPKLPEIVHKHKKQIGVHKKNLLEIGKLLEELVEHNRFNIQKTGTVRFNPFDNTGGDMSFSIALLDGYDNGIVISSLHGRERTRMYAKPIERGNSKYLLTDEEREAIRQANRKFPKKIKGGTG